MPIFKEILIDGQWLRNPWDAPVLAEHKRQWLKARKSGNNARCGQLALEVKQFAEGCPKQWVFTGREALECSDGERDRVTMPDADTPA